MGDYNLSAEEANLAKVCCHDFTVCYGQYVDILPRTKAFSIAS